MEIVAEVADLRSDTLSIEASIAEHIALVEKSQRRSQRTIDKRNLEKSNQPIHDPLIPDPVFNRPRRIHRTQRCYRVHRGYFCAAAHAKHTPKPYSSLRPVIFFFLYMFLLCTIEAQYAFSYIPVPQMSRTFVLLGIY